MAKRLLLNVLLSVLGDYVEGLSEENLKLGVWSGEIQLNHLQINRTVLQRLNLPVVIHHGSIKNLHIRIPWASLESNPLKVSIDGIYLQVGPLDLSKMAANELHVRAIEMKAFRLQEIGKWRLFLLHQLILLEYPLLCILCFHSLLLLLPPLNLNRLVYL